MTLCATQSINPRSVIAYSGDSRYGEEYHLHEERTELTTKHFVQRRLVVSTSLPSIRALVGYDPGYW